MACRSRICVTIALLSLLTTACGAGTGGAHVTVKKSRVASSDTARATTHAPTPAAFPSGPEGASARRGFAILAATRDSMPEYVGNSLRCFSCHLDNGQRANGIPLTGVCARFPAYTARDGRMASIQDRINNCFERSLAGRAIPVGSREMTDIVTYLALVSRGVAIGTHVRGEGLPSMSDLSGDTSRGASIFMARCARCHGVEGQGIPPAPPVWGAQSYSIGASLARLSRAASFIGHNMPYDSAGVLSDQQAFDVAAYILAQPRPDLRGKERDWSTGGAPSDVPYDTHGHKAFNPPGRLLPSPSSLPTPSSSPLRVRGDGPATSSSPPARSSIPPLRSSPAPAPA